jgi:dTDP-4-amino-4,6-dideoxygalactose transaminase
MEQATTQIMPVPLLDLKAQYAAIKAEIQEAMERVIESQYFILGPEVQALEEEVSAYSQCKYGIGISSGTDALLVVLMAIGVQPGDEVITVPYSFFATAGCVARLGVKPVFVEVDPYTYNMDPAGLEAAITERTKAIIPVHLFGQMAEMDPIMEVAERHKLYVIEDAAQAIGCEYKGRRAGSIGHFGCFSFFPSKNLGGFGDGGLVTANDPELAAMVKILRGHGAEPKYYHKYIGGNFRLDALQAAVLRVKLRYLDNWSEARQHNADTYRRLFTKAGVAIEPAAVAHFQDGGDDLQQMRPGKIILPTELAGYRHIYNQFVIRCSRRDALMAHLKKHQIGCEIYYPVPLHLQECFAYLGHKPGDFPISETAANETLALPIYPELTKEMQQAVVETIANFYAQENPQ